MSKVTYGFVKPDAYEHSKEIEDMLINDGFTIAAKKEKEFSEEGIREHYKEHSTKSWFSDLIKYIGSGKTKHYVLYREDKEAIQALSDLAGPTDATKASKDTIRGKYGTDGKKNGFHRADSKKSAVREIRLHFREDELPDYINDYLFYMNTEFM